MKASNGVTGGRRNQKRVIMSKSIEATAAAMKHEIKAAATISVIWRKMAAIKT